MLVVYMCTIGEYIGNLCTCPIYCEPKSVHKKKKGFVFVNKKNLVAKKRRSVQKGTNGNSILDREIISLYFFRKNIDL